MSKSSIKTIIPLNYDHAKIFDFDNNFKDLNLSFGDLSPKDKDKIFDKDINFKKIDFIEEKNEENNENNEIESILNDLDKNIEINIKETDIENNNYQECQEILNILRRPLSHKNLQFFYSPFKPLVTPRKISMEGKVLCSVSNCEINNANSIETQSS